MHKTAARLLLVALAALLFWGGVSPSITANTPEADDYLIVDCLLPGTVRRLGTKVTFVSPRRPIRTTALDCRIRGGEYVSHDPASYQSALKEWTRLAQAGDAEAQLYLGEIYERGLGVAAEPARAEEWYRKSADQGSTAAMINLGHLYERGLGRAQDLAEAARWYRKASGLPEDLEPIQFQGEQDAGLVASLRDQVATLRSELERQQGETERARGALERAERERQQAEQSRERADQALAAARGERDQALSQVAEREEVAKDLQRRLGEARASVGEREQVASGLRQQLEQARAAGRSQDQLGELEKELAWADGQLRDAQASVARFEGELEQARAELTSVRGQLASAREQLERAEGELAASQSQLKEARGDVARLAGQLDTTQAELVERKKVERELRDQITTLEDQLAGPSIEITQPPLTLGALDTRATMPSYRVPDALTEWEIEGRVLAPAGLKQLMLNDLELRPDGRGSFQATIRLEDKQVPVRVTATDARERAAQVAFLIERALDVASPAPPEPLVPAERFGRYYALVIGNQSYANLPDLKTPINDARAISQLLESRYGFEVTVLEDANRYQILSAINDLREKLNSDDNLLIYYGGHGELDRANDRGHWLPVDAEPGSTANWISNVDITDLVNAIPTRHLLVIVDACYSGTLTRSSQAQLRTGMTEGQRRHWIEVMLGKRSRNVLTSGGVKPVPDVGGGDHSVFAKALLQVLRSNRSVLEGQRLAQEVAARVVRQSPIEQTPLYAPIRFAGHEGGEFFLIPHT